MKVLSVIQPWASLLVNGYKNYETRCWHTPHRGRIAIHASLKLNHEIKAYSEIPEVKKLIEKMGYNLETMPRGLIIGTMTIKEVYPTSIMPIQDQSAEGLFGDFRAGRFAWQMTEPFILANPVPCKGKQRIFEIPDDLFKDIPQCFK